MPTEKGVVIKTEGERAWVKTEKSSACEGCASRNSCSNPDGGKEMEVRALNGAGAKTGDRVLISFGTAPLVKVYTLVYIFPILALLMGAIFGQQLAVHFSMDESLTALVTGFLFFIGAFFIVKSISSRMAKKDGYQPEVMRILSGSK